MAKLEKLLRPILKKQKYSNLEFSKPQMGKDIILEFSIQDSDTEREEYDSKNQLKKLFNKKLKDTNWKLMSDGISYRLGILTGRLRGN